MSKSYDDITDFRTRDVRAGRRVLRESITAPSKAAFAAKMGRGSDMDPNAATQLYGLLTDDAVDVDAYLDDVAAESERKMADDVEENSELYEALADGPDEDDGSTDADSGSQGGGNSTRVEVPPQKAPHLSGQSEASNSGSSEDDDGDTEVDVRGHYNRDGVAAVYESLGETVDGQLAIGNQDFLGWYRTRSADSDATGEGRAWSLAKEFDELKRGIDRVAYFAINYVEPQWFMDAWAEYDSTPDGRSWRTDGGEKPTPGYADLEAYAPYADIDIEKPLKYDRAEDDQGDVPVEAIEGAIDQYVDAFADLAGSRDHVFALDSVGGAYVMLAPTTTRPIALEFDGDDRAVIFEALGSRLNKYLDDTAAAVRESNPEAADVFEPDTVNHKNRLSKAPMSLHKSMDGVVTPIDVHDPQGVTYDFTPADAVDDELVAECKQWADDFTAAHFVATDSIVETLWPEQYGRADGWADALQLFLDDREALMEEQKQKEAEKPDIRDIPDDIETTDNIEDLNVIIENIDVADLAADLASDWATGNRGSSGPTRFEPSWRNSDSGTSCYADSDKFVDLKEGKNGGGAAKLMARHEGIITHCSQKITGDDYWRVVTALRKHGYDIPRFEGYNGKHPDVLELYDDPEDDEEAKRQVMRQLFSE